MLNANNSENQIKTIVLYSVLPHKCETCETNEYEFLAPSPTVEPNHKDTQEHTVYDNAKEHYITVCVNYWVLWIQLFFTTKLFLQVGHKLLPPHGVIKKLHEAEAPTLHSETCRYRYTVHKNTTGT